MKMLKKIIVLICTLIMVISFAGCGDESSQSSDKAAPESAQSDAVEDAVKTGDADIDLTQLSKSMVYSEVYNMVSAPDDYVGKTVKMSGSFAVYESETDRYFACIISDATACCSQGIEFTLAGEKTYPDDYPEIDSTINVIGVFGTYTEGDQQYCRLENAEIVQ